MQYQFVGEELPPAKRRSNRKRSVHEKFADALRANPGEWARFPVKLARTSRTSYVTLINGGKLKAFTETGFEAAVRAGELYVRWMPAEPDTEAA